MKFIRKVGKRERMKRKRNERRDTTSEDDNDDDDKATKFFFSFRTKKCSIKSHITSNANCDYTRSMYALSYAVAVVRPFLNATHVTNIGFYLCVFLDTTDRTRMPFAWYVNINMFSSTQIVGFSFLSQSFARTFFTTFARAFLATHLFIRLFALGCLLFRKLVCTHVLTLFHSLSLARWFVAFAHLFAILNLFYPHFQSNLWLNTSGSFPLTLLHPFSLSPSLYVVAPTRVPFNYLICVSYPSLHFFIFFGRYLRFDFIWCDMRWQYQNDGLRSTTKKTTKLTIPLASDFDRIFVIVWMRGVFLFLSLSLVHTVYELITITCCHHHFYRPNNDNIDSHRLFDNKFVAIIAENM